MTMQRFVVVEKRRVNRFGRPVNHDAGEQFVLRETLFDIALAIAPRAAYAPQRTSVR